MSDDVGIIIENAMDDCDGSTAYSMDRNRPYDGQPHTDSGERGKTLVEGLTMRDIADCIVMGFLEATGGAKENPVYNDVYGVDCDFDPIAVVQNAMCQAEKMMGIFPNVPPLEVTEEDPTDGQ